MSDLPEHSPVGGSGAYRFMPCPASVPLSYSIEDDDDEFSLPGNQAHALAEYCLKTGAEPWSLIREDLVVDKEMADAVQVYVGAVHSAHPKDQFNHWRHCLIELGFHCPDIHEYFWGKADFVCFVDNILHVWDFKFGAGIMIDVEDNPQCKYYAAGVLEKLNRWNDIDTAVLHIAQPRGFHSDGPIREWSISTEELEQWTFDELVPAMDRALASDGTDTASGEHCRFCSARSHACPQLISDFEELEQMLVELSKLNSADELTNEQVGRFLDLLEVAKIAGKQANKTAFNRMNAGATIPGRKLAKAKSNREWKENEEDMRALAFAQFSQKSMEPAKLKSPAQIEALPEGKAFAARYAYKPDKGKTVALDKDSRPEVSVKLAAMFEDQTKKGKSNE